MVSDQRKMSPVYMRALCFGSYKRGPFALFAGRNNLRNYDIKAILLMINPLRKLCVKNVTFGAICSSNSAPLIECG